MMRATPKIQDYAVIGDGARVALRDVGPLGVRLELGSTLLSERYGPTVVRQLEPPHR